MIKNGVYASFCTKTGLKTFKTKEQAEHSYEAQKIAAEHGLAPPVIRMVDECSYLSEIADTSYFDRKYPNKAKYLYGEYKELYLKVREVLPGRITYDIHSRNLGYYKGKVVLLDFYP